MNIDCNCGHAHCAYCQMLAASAPLSEAESALCDAILAKTEIVARTEFLPAEPGEFGERTKIALPVLPRERLEVEGTKVSLTLEASFGTFDAWEVRTTLLDALAEFTSARHNGRAEEYVDKRYPYMKGEQRDKKIAEVARRCAIARALRHHIDIE